MAATGGSSSHLVGRVSAQEVGSESAPRRTALLMILGCMSAAPRGLIFGVSCAHLRVGGGKGGGGVGYHACDLRPLVSAPRRGCGKGLAPEALAASHHQQPHPGACAEASVLVLKAHLRRAMRIFA